MRYNTIMSLWKYVILFFTSILFLHASAHRTFRNDHSRVKLTFDQDFKQFSVHSVEEIEKIPVKIYYETLCPASVEFFSRQLKPVLQTIASYVDVQLVPYGHATTTKRFGQYHFRCQHGAAECYGNKLHACVIHHVRNSTQAALFNICLMQNTYYQSKAGSESGYNYGSALHWCSQVLMIPATEIAWCVNSKQGSALLKAFGEDTHQLRPRYVPYVIINGSTEKQDDAMRNLFDTVCQLLAPNTTNHCNTVNTRPLRKF